MRKIISNSTPLIALNKVGKLNLLKEIYGEIIIPYAVYEEVIIKPKLKDIDDFIQNSGFIKIVRIKNNEAKEFFQPSLHKGEIEVMILAREEKADLSIIDDLLARKYAKYHNLKITGTIGVLIKAKETGLIPEIKPIIDELINSGIYIDKRLYEKVIKMAKE